jgi:hypothetical protein
MRPPEHEGKRLIFRINYTYNTLSMQYFSDRDQANTEIPTTNEISIDVWNGIAAVVNALVANKLLAKAFPKQCPDGNGIIGVNDSNLYLLAITSIPDMKDLLPQQGDIQSLSESFFVSPFDQNYNPENERKRFTYCVLDFIEFIYRHIHDVQNGVFHDYFKHYELVFPDTTYKKDKFASDINEIFNRNHIAFKLLDNGSIERIVKEDLLQPIEKVGEETVDKLIEDALIRFKSPKFDEKKIALEKLWDAFERIKTIYGSKKKESAEQLLEKVCHGQDTLKELLGKEFRELTETGNNFEIRHFETDTLPIKSDELLDYLFYRMYLLLWYVSIALKEGA